VLAAINPKKKEDPHTRVFWPWSKDELRAWVVQYNVEFKWNIYLQPNRPNDAWDGDGKMGDKDVGYMDVRHADLDPDDKLPWDEAQAALDAKVAALQPPPSAVDHTGNGRAVYWKLAEPVKIESYEHCRELRLYNLKLVEQEAADKCAALSWLMRAPGTINYPNEAKLKKGRTVCQSRNLLQTDRVYTLDQFEKAEPEKEAPQEFVTNVKWGNGGNPWTHAVDLSMLDQYRVSDRIKQIIQRGKMPGETRKATTAARSGNTRPAVRWYDVASMTRFTLTC
jgi:hypothetical protein